MKNEKLNLPDFVMQAGIKNNKCTPYYIGKN